MSLAFLFQKAGEARFPSSAADVPAGQLFAAFDPARDRLIALFRAAILQELAHATDGTVAADSPWGVARQGTNLASAAPVADTFYYAPTADLLKSENLKLPLLCVYRVSAEHSEKTLVIEQEASTWGLDYILPPLGGADLRRLGGALDAVRKLVPIVVRRRGHPAFEGGALQFGDGKGTLSTVKVRASQQGPASFSPQGDGPTYYAVHFDLETVELDGQLDGVDADFEGVDMSFGLGGSEGVVPDLLEARTDDVPDPDYGEPFR